MKFLDKSELLALLKAARARSNRDWAIMLLTYRHGMRASEITSLLLKDVDLKACSITVRRLKGSMTSIQPLEKLAGHPLLDEPNALRLWLEDRRDDSDYLFTSQKGGRLTANGFWRLFKVIATEAGIEGRSCHSLKHTRASLAIAGGAPISDVRQLLGHRSLSSTLRYISSTDQQAAVSARKAEANLF